MLSVYLEIEGVVGHREAQSRRMNIKHYLFMSVKWHLHTRTYIQQ